MWDAWEWQTYGSEKCSRPKRFMGINYGWTIAEQSTDSTDNGVRSIRFEVLVRACRGLENLKVLWSSKSLSAVQGTLWQCSRSTGYFLFRLSTETDLYSLTATLTMAHISVL